MLLKDLLNQEKIKNGFLEFRRDAGEFLEKSIEKTMEKTDFQAPLLEGMPASGIWYRVPVPEGMAGDGSEYHIYIRKGTTDNLCLFFSGGGVAWNEYTAAHPVTGAAVASESPNYYWNNLRPFTQMMNINTGITDCESVRNPFRDWNFAVITYATGDFHVGNNDFCYREENGAEKILHFHGYKNFQGAMRRAVRYFPRAEKLLIAGDSAGAFAVPALAGEIAERWYKDCGDITLFSDSALLLYDRWRETARDIWKAPADIADMIQGSNIVLDWYTALYQKYGSRFRYLYASSTHDYLLSIYYNDVTTKTYGTDAEVQDVYYRQLRQTARELKLLYPAFGLYFNSWKNMATKGGTIHTAVRHPYFFVHRKNGISMAKWLFDAVRGEILDVDPEGVLL